jgi:hypothetical protein
VQELNQALENAGQAEAAESDGAAPGQSQPTRNRFHEFDEAPCGKTRIDL